MKHRAASVLSFLTAAALGCGGGTGAASSPGRTVLRSTESRWQDAFDAAPDLVVVIRPQALRRDTVYGPLLRRGIAVAREHSRMAVATGTLDVILDADEIVVGARDSGTRKAQGAKEEIDDLVVVVRGVRAENDPAKLLDEGGSTLWAPGPNAPAADVRELLRVHDAEEGDASLFELPGRTWVIATGPARMRVREAFTRGVIGESAFSRPSPAPTHVLDGLDPNALAIARVSGPALLARVGTLRPPGLLAPVGHDLVALTVALSPGEDAIVRATFKYKAEEPLELAETTMRDAMRVLLGARPEEYGWLRSATVTRTQCCVVVTTPLPGRLAGRFLRPVSALPLPDAAATH